jgi:hypothetical protein
VNPYQSQYIELLRNNALPISDEQREAIYDRLQREASRNPQVATELDIRVANAAYKQGIRSEVAARILAESPYIKSQIAQGASVTGLTANYLTPLAAAYIRRQTYDAIGEIRTQRETTPEQVSAPKAVKDMGAVFLGAGYTVLRTAEQSLFAIAPLPLEKIKSGMQQVGVPLVATAVASHIPGAEQLINTAMHFGGDVLGNGARAVAANTLGDWGQKIHAALPTGMGVQSGVGMVGDAVSPLVTNTAQRTGQFLGQTATAVTIGKTLINSGQSVFNQVREKGIQQTIGDAIVATQAVIARTKAFVQSAQTKISNFIQGHKTMSQNLIPENYGLSQADGLTVEKARELGGDSFAKTVAGIQTTRDDLNDCYARASIPGFEYLRETDRVRNLEAQLEDQKQTLANDIERYGYEPDLAATQVETEIQNDLWLDELSEEPSLNGHGPDSEEAEEGIFTPLSEAEVLDELELTEPSLDSEPVLPEPIAEAIPAEIEPPIHKENEDYALTLNTMLAQSNIDTQRFQIDVNGVTAFKMENYAVAQNNLDARTVETIRTALHDPANLKGEVKITQGSKVLLHVKDGQVIQDSVRFIDTKTPKIEVNESSKMLYDQASKEAKGIGLERTQAIAANAFRCGATQEAVKEAIKSHDPEYSRQVKEIGSEKGADMAINAAIQGAKTQVAMEKHAPAQTQEREMAAQR